VTPDEARPPAARRSRWIVDVIQTLVITLVLFVGIQTFIAQPFEVRMTSMQHTLEDGDYVLIDKLTPRFDGYKLGDVVVFEPPTGFAGGTPFIKRVIGLPGDTVEIRSDARVYVNGTALDEPYVFNSSGAAGTTSEPAAWTVRSGQLFVLGDHRDKSDDSRVFGPIAQGSVVGRAFFRYWPLDHLGVLVTPVYVPAPSRAREAATASG
jgi:signal peptidase I